MWFVFTILVEVFTNHILAKNIFYEWKEYKIFVLKPSYQIISTKLSGNVIVSKAFLSMMSSIISSKSFLNITFYEAENDNLLRQDDSPFKSLFAIWIAQGPEKYLIKLWNSCSLTKFQGISKFMTSRPQSLQPSYFFTLE